MNYRRKNPEISKNSDHTSYENTDGIAKIKDYGKEAIPEIKDSIENLSDEIKNGEKDITASKEEVYKEIENAFLKDKRLMAKLIKTADKFKYIYQIKEEYTISSEDIVMETIADILECKRKWYKNKCENIIVLIIGVIKSKISNYKTSDEYEWSKKIVTLYPPKPGSDNESSENCIYDEERVKNFNSDNEDEYIEKEEYYDKLLELFNDDETAFCVFDELLSSKDYNTKDQNRLLAKRLGITVREVENAKKRIRYKLSTNKDLKINK